MLFVVPPFRIKVLLLVLVRNECDGLVGGHFGILANQGCSSEDVEL